MIKKGRHCTCNILTGEKTYKSKRACDFAVKAQTEAYSRGIGPKVIRRVDDFTYITEIVDTKEFEDLPQGRDYKMYDEYPELYEALIPIFKDSPRPDRHSRNKVDLKKVNIGRDKNGNVVMVDFY